MAAARRSLARCRSLANELGGCCGGGGDPERTHKADARIWARIRAGTTTTSSGPGARTGAPFGVRELRRHSTIGAHHRRPRGR